MDISGRHWTSSTRICNQPRSSAMESRTMDHLEPWHELPNKVVMVTGASSGLGLEFCLDLARAGCRVVAAARRVDRLKSLCDEINGPAYSSNQEADQSSPRAVAVELDISADGFAVERSVQRAWDAFGRIDALVNNAGVRGSVKSPLELSEEEWEHTFGTNAKGSWLVAKHVCIRMRDSHRGGSVINIASAAGLDRTEAAGGLAYACSKAALNMMTKVMALELGVYEIRVNTIAPGIFKSEITQGLMQKHWFDKMTRRIVPLQTHGTTDPALTSLLRYLIHDSSEYVSGNIFIVDSGGTLPGVPIFSSL